MSEGPHSGGLRVPALEIMLGASSAETEHSVSSDTGETDSCQRCDHQRECTRVIGRTRACGREPAHGACRRCCRPAGRACPASRIRCRSAAAADRPGTEGHGDLDGAAEGGIGEPNCVQPEDTGALRAGASNRDGAQGDLSCQRSRTSSSKPGGRQARVEVRIADAVRLSSTAHNRHVARGLHVNVDCPCA